MQPQYPCGRCNLCVSGDYIHCEDGHNYKEFTGREHGASTMAQYILKPSWILSKIPDDVSYEHASLACCALGPSFNAFEKMNVNSFDTVLITGIGPRWIRRDHECEVSGALASSLWSRFRGALNEQRKWARLP